MHRITAAFFTLALLATPALAVDQPPTPTLTATAEGEMLVVPDIVTVTLGVISEAKSAAEALASNSKDMETVIAAIKAAGVPEKDIATTGFNVSPVYVRPTPDQPDIQPKITGYQVSNQLRVTIRDLRASGGILDKVIAAGANQVNGISFDVAHPDQPADAALKDAIAQAKKKAELMAEAAGVELVRILSVTTGSGPRPVFVAFDGGMPRAANAVPVMAGERTVSATATIVWEIAER
jgi:uncharacterized protein YggE